MKSLLSLLLLVATSRTASAQGALLLQRSPGVGKPGGILLCRPAPGADPVSIPIANGYTGELWIDSGSGNAAAIRPIPGARFDYGTSGDTSPLKLMVPGHWGGEKPRLQLRVWFNDSGSIGSWDEAERRQVCRGRSGFIAYYELAGIDADNSPHVGSGGLTSFGMASPLESEDSVSPRLSTPAEESHWPLGQPIPLEGDIESAPASDLSVYLDGRLVRPRREPGSGKLFLDGPGLGIHDLVFTVSQEAGASATSTFRRFYVFPGDDANPPTQFLLPHVTPNRPPYYLIWLHEAGAYRVDQSQDLKMWVEGTASRPPGRTLVYVPSAVSPTSRQYFRVVRIGD